MKNLDYSLKMNHKKKALGTKKTPEARAQRNKQFKYINGIVPSNYSVKIPETVDI